MNLDLSGKLVNYKISGKGDPLLLIHGWGGSSNSLEKLAQLLSSEYKAITLDLPGFGQSDRPESDWGVGEYAKFLVDFIDRLNLKPVICCFLINR